MGFASLNPSYGLIGDVTKIALYLAVAYLAYGIAYMAADYFAGRQKSPCKYFRRFFRAMIYLIILLIAALDALEYLMYTAGILPA